MYVMRRIMLIAICGLLFMTCTPREVLSVGSTTSSAQQTEQSLQKAITKGEDLKKKFTAVPIAPKNQKTGVNDRFDLKVTPGSDNTLIITFVNSGKETLVLYPEVTPATTDSNGSLDYIGQTGELTNDSTLLQEVSFTYAKEIKIPGTKTENNSVDFKIQVKLPETSFQGTLVYGLSVWDKNKKAVNLITPIYLNEGEETPAPKLTMSNVRFDQESNQLMADVANSSPLLIENVNFSYQLSHGSSNRFTGQNNDIKLAPYGIYTIHFDVGNFKAKGSTFILSASSGDYTEEWETQVENDEKVVAPVSSGEKSTNVVPKQSFLSRHFKLILILIFIIVIGVSVFFGYHEYQRVQYEKRRKRNKRKRIQAEDISSSDVGMSQSLQRPQRPRPYQKSKGDKNRERQKTKKR